MFAALTGFLYIAAGNSLIIHYSFFTIHYSFSEALCKGTTFRGRRSGTKGTLGRPPPIPLAVFPLHSLFPNPQTLSRPPLCGFWQFVVGCNGFGIPVEVLCYSFLPNCPQISTPFQKSNIFSKKLLTNRYICSIIQIRTNVLNICADRK